MGDQSQSDHEVFGSEIRLAVGTYLIHRVRRLHGLLQSLELCG